MKYYLMKMKAIYNTLAACEPPVPDEDQVFSILAELGLEVEPRITDSYFKK